MADALNIGGRRELFVDDFMIESLSGLTQRLNRLEGRETAISMSGVWDGAFQGYPSICSHEGVHYFYYRGAHWQDVRDPDNREWTDQVTCLAMSTDGIHWEKPNLGLYEVSGTRKNNVVLSDPVYSHNFSVFLDTKPDTPADERFKALAGCPHFMSGPERYPGHPLGVAAFVSGDGIHWRPCADAPVLTEAHWPEETDNGSLPAFWSPIDQCYVLYVRIRVGPRDLPTHQRLRWFGRTTSFDFIDWTPIEPIDYDLAYTDEELRAGAANPSEGPVEQLYTIQARPYPRADHITFAFPNRYVHRRVVGEEEMKALRMGPGRRPSADESVHDAIFMTSRDGMDFDTTFKEAIVRPGADRRNWGNRNCYVATGMIRTGETELSLYYDRFGSTRTDPSIAEYFRCSTRLDGFVAIHAPYAGGELLTKPFVFDGRRLEVNYETSAAGALCVDLLDGEGKPIPGYVQSGDDLLVGDEVSRTVRWDGSEDVSSLAGETIRLRFRMKDSDLYSFRFK
jgi:hypothetical protein